MTSRNEWEEYFELINNRKPNADEITAALQKGEFIDGQAQSDRPEIKIDSQQISKGVEETKEQAGKAFNTVKQHAGNYFSWFKNRALRPMKYVNEENPNQLYLWLTFALTTVCSAGIFWNFVRRIFVSLANVVGNDNSYGRSIASFAGRILPSVFFNFFFVFVILFLAALPGLALVTKEQEKFKDLVNQFLVFQPAAAIFAIIGFIYSFIAQVPKVSVDNISSVLQEIMINVGILIMLPMLSFAVVNLAAVYFVQKYRENDQKLDLIWWQISQAIMTAIVVYIGYIVIITPMFKSLISTIANFNY